MQKITKVLLVASTADSRALADDLRGLDRWLIDSADLADGERDSCDRPGPRGCQECEACDAYYEQRLDCEREDR